MSFLKRFITIVQCKRYGIQHKNGMLIHPLFRAIGSKCIEIGENVHLHRNVLIDCGVNGSVVLAGGVSINSYTRIEAENKVLLEENVLIGPNVYISDRNHNYLDVDTPIMNQGYYSKGKVLIGSGSWVGIHAAIIGNVTIGKHCVIGANAVVTKDIPDFSVVAGNPAKIVKRYDIKSKEWKKYNEDYR